ncbi:MAG: polyphenol oxidoreductase [Epsilonproteobacteria bacterium]|nr:MAG: polyphenol oxidoreductase [Campylobacterota bacterium]RLA66439.1 MAG: polyphenol oxidoreductase [Campylobacterota bacterium]
MEIFKKKFPEGQFTVFNAPPNFDFKKINQVHGTNIVSSGDVQADGLISSSKDNLAIITADCMPILLIGAQGDAFIHAGWRGLQSGILKKDILKSIGVNKAFIGPHINNCCFEVTSEFLNYFPRSYFKEKNGKYYFSLKDVAMLHLKNYFGNIEISYAKECTHCDLKFHSYRRNRTIKRNWNIWIPLTPDTLIGKK